jgi:hypothetical protein
MDTTSLYMYIKSRAISAKSTAQKKETNSVFVKVMVMKNLS